MKNKELIPSEVKKISIVIRYGEEPTVNNATFSHPDMDYAFITLHNTIKQRGWTIVVTFDVRTKSPITVYALHHVSNQRLSRVKVSEPTQQALYEAIYDCVDDTWEQIHDFDERKPRNEDELPSGTSA